MVPVLPDSFHLIRLLRVSVLEFVLLSQLLVLVNCVDQFLLNFLYFLEKQVMLFLEFQPFVFRVDVFEILGQNAELPGYEVVPFVKPFELLVNHDKSLFPNRVRRYLFCVLSVILAGLLNLTDGLSVLLVSSLTVLNWRRLLHILLIYHWLRVWINDRLRELSC